MYPHCAYAVSEKYGETGERYVRTHRRNAWARGDQCFGWLGRENDCVIPWSAVKTMGEDAVLVDHIPVKRTPKRSFLQNFFENG